MTNIRREKSHTFQRAFRMTSWLSSCGVLQSSGIPWLFFLLFFWKEKKFVVYPVALNTNFTMLKVKGQWSFIFIQFLCTFLVFLCFNLFPFVAFSGSRVWNGNWAPYCLVRRNLKEWGEQKGNKNREVHTRNFYITHEWIICGPEFSDIDLYRYSKDVYMYIYIYRYSQLRKTWDVVALSSIYFFSPSSLQEAIW